MLVSLFFIVSSLFCLVPLCVPFLFLSSLFEFSLFRFSLLSVFPLSFLSSLFFLLSYLFPFLSSLLSVICFCPFPLFKFSLFRLRCCCPFSFFFFFLRLPFVSVVVVLSSPSLLRLCCSSFLFSSPLPSRFSWFSLLAMDLINR